MTDILLLCAVYGLVFIIQSSELLNRPRFWIVGKSPFINSLISCAFCLGFHCGWIVYLMSMKSFSLTSMILWALAGATFSYVVDRFMEVKGIL